MMDSKAHSVLVIANDPATLATIRAALAEPAEDRYATVWVRHLSAALARLDEGGIDAILLDPFLPDSHGIVTFDRVFVAAAASRSWSSRAGIKKTSPGKRSSTARRIMY